MIATDFKTIWEMSVQTSGLILMKFCNSTKNILKTMRHLVAFFSVFIVFFTVLGKPSIAQGLVKICDDFSQWAPYSYTPKSAAGVNSPKRIGLMIDFLTEIFEILGLEYTLEPTNWNRCTKSVEDFAKYKKYEIFINGADTPDRDKKYFVTKPIYTTRQGVFFSLKKFPKGPKITSQNDLKNYKICAVRGNDYSIVGLSKEDFFTTGKTIETVLLMLSRGRCEIVVSSMEPVYGSKLTGDSMIPKDVSSFPLPNTKNPTFNIFISRGSPRGKVLQEKINQAITTLKERGVWDRIFDKYQALLRTN